MRDPQPLVSDDGQIALVMDGYLANWEDLRRELRDHGCALRDDSDAELILHAYQIWDADCASRLEGEFSFVLWDDRQKRIFAARDHHGLRPLLYVQSGPLLIFATEPAAIIAALPQHPPLNRAYLAEVATDEWFSAEETIWQGVQRVPQAHYLLADRESLALHQHWTLPLGQSHSFCSDDEYYEAYRHMLEECVRRASRTDAPLGCEVSGGLDSSAVYCVAHKQLVNGSLPAPGLRGYTLYGPADSDADERIFARAVGKHTGSHIVESPMTHPGLGWFADNALTSRDLPPAPNAAMSLAQEQRMAADGCRVFLTGIGGDQWLDGTHFYYREMLEAGEWTCLAKIARRDAAAMGAGETLRLFARYGAGTYLPRGLRRFARRFILRNRDEWIADTQWLRPRWQNALQTRKAEYEARLPAEYRASYKLRKWQFPHWPYVLDQASRQRANSGLEMRSPLMARRFIEFSVRTPEHLLLRDGWNKYIHRKALDDILPEEIAWRESKAEFSAAYHALEDDIFAIMSEHPPDALAQIAETGRIVKLFASYRRAKIDARRPGTIWGAYVCALMLVLTADNDVQEMSR